MARFNGKRKATDKRYFEMTNEPRIIKYESDKFIEKGDYYGAIWETLKESGVLFNKCSKIKKMNFEKNKRNEHR